MRRLLSSSEATDLDSRSTLDYGLPGLALMEQAGLRLYQALLDVWKPTNSSTAAFLVGKGNNGGDALVIARNAFVEGRFRPFLVFVEPSKTEEAQLQRRVADRLGLASADWGTPEAQRFLEDSDLWVDGLYGVGLRPGLRPETVRIFHDLTLIRGVRNIPVAAIDVPSGVSDAEDPLRPAWPCRWTFTVAYAKVSCYLPANRADAGEIVTVPLGFPARPDLQGASTWLWDADDLGLLGGTIDPDAWKTRRGRVGVAAGSPGLTGAAVLACRSAQSAGAGLVTGLFDDEIRSGLAGIFPSVMTRSMDEPGFQPEKFDACVVGPGWGRAPGRQNLWRVFFSSPTPLVVDADGLRVLARSIRQGEPFFRQNWILTPHPGEWKDLCQALAETGIESGQGFLDRSETLARATGAVVVVKGSVTWVVSPEGRRGVWDGREPSLATGGTGDCLAGFVGAYLARGRSAWDAANAGVVLHGTVGRRLGRERGWFTAEDLAREASAAAACAARASDLSFQGE